MNWFQAQMLEVGSQIEWSGRHGQICGRKFDASGITSHIKLHFEDGEKTGWIDVRDIGGVNFIPREF